eukprot:3859357-Rhodomonas_salina.1
MPLSYLPRRAPPRSTHTHRIGGVVAAYAMSVPYSRSQCAHAIDLARTQVIDLVESVSGHTHRIHEAEAEVYPPTLPSYPLSGTDMPYAPM